MGPPDGRDCQWGVWTVIKARHRLDGILYAIKITKDTVEGATERGAMKEVFAHAVLKKAQECCQLLQFLGRGWQIVYTERVLQRWQPGNADQTEEGPWRALLGGGAGQGVGGRDERAEVHPQQAVGAS